MTIKNALKNLFDWKSHPGNVWFFAAPLAVIGIGCQLAIAILHLVNEGNPWFLVIAVSLLSLGGFAFWHMYKTFRRRG
jgi:hypothetical protein